MPTWRDTNAARLKSRAGVGDSQIGRAIAGGDIEGQRETRSADSRLRRPVRSEDGSTRAIATDSARHTREGWDRR